MAMVLASKIIQVVILRELLRSDVELAAQALLGCLMVKGNVSVQIVETEAYTWDDPGCHAYKKERMKNMAMYGEPGTSYVYFTYGNHWMVNVVADRLGRAGAVLIRAAKPVSGLEDIWENRPNITKEVELMAGPGRMTKSLGINSEHNMLDLFDHQSLLRIVKTGHVPVIQQSRRIGIAPGKGDELVRRYVDVSLLEWATKHKLNLELHNQK